MAKAHKKIRISFRRIVQLLFAAVTNGYIAGFLKGKIYTGPTKSICLPGLNCYSCPGALGSCPIGSLQAVLSSQGRYVSFYVVGFLMIVGALIGRVVCGFLCPFGLVQDLLYKIPFVKKWGKLPGDKWLKWLKYVILVLFVILLPLLVVDIVGQGQPWFCKYICPSGTLGAGIPLVALNQGLAAAAGGLFIWKIALLAILLVLSIMVYRPFCRYLCPLGAIYGLFNKISLYRYQVDPKTCISCKACQKACKWDIPAYQKPNSIECIRCGECKSACPTGAIYTTLQRGKKTVCSGKNSMAEK